MSGIARFQLTSIKNWGILILITALIILNVLPPPRNAITYDVFGYYLYLPMLFIHQNLDFADLDLVNRLVEHYKNTPTLYQLSLIDGQKHIILYTAGMAILYSPFFFIGHFIALVFDFPADGFSIPYQRSLWIGSILITIAGFILIKKVLDRYFKNGVVQLTLILIFFGTNMLVHTGMFGSNCMSHNYLFFLYAALIYFTDSYYSTNLKKYWYLAILTSSIMTLTRPVEISSFLIPLLWGWRSSFSLKMKELFSDRKRIFYSLIIILGIGSIQSLYWKLYCNHFFVDSYTNAGEGLDLLSPHTLNYLFSFRKGWILYTPLVGVSLVGFIFLYKRNLSIFYALLLSTVFAIYLASSWTVWWYSGSFSSRAALPLYSILSFPLAALIQYVSEVKRKTIIKYVFYCLISLLVFLNLFQSWQFIRGIIDPERMTRAAYFKNFLSIHRHPETDGLLIKSRDQSGIDLLDTSQNYSRRIIGFEDMEYGKNDNYVTDPVFDGKYSQRVSASGFSKELWIPFNAITTKDYAYLKVSAYVFIPSKEDSVIKASLCAEMKYKNKVYFWRSLNLENLILPKNQWQYIELYYLTPEVRTRQDVFKTYLWNRGNQDIYIDNMKLEAFY